MKSVEKLFQRWDQEVQLELKSVIVGEQHRVIRDKWLDTKRVVDRLIRFKTPFGRQESFSIDVQQLPYREQILFPQIMLSLCDIGIITDWHRRDREDVVSMTSSEARHEKLQSGQTIYVGYWEILGDIQKKLSEIVIQIEDDGIKRFAPHYENTIQQRSDINQLPIIQYNIESGTGTVNGLSFKFTDGTADFIIFNELYTHICQKITKERILKLIGKYQEPDDTPDIGKVLTALGDKTGSRRKTVRAVTETEIINDIAKSIREKTDLNTEQLVLNNQNLTLLARK